MTSGILKAANGIMVLYAVASTNITGVMNIYLFAMS